MPKDRLTIDEFRAFLQDLAKMGLRVTGSYARGDWGPNSDLDFVCKSAGSEPREHQPITRAMEAMRRHGIKVESILPGQIASPRDLVHLPIPVEIMEEGWVDPIPKSQRSAKVEICGVIFKTW